MSDPCTSLVGGSCQGLGFIWGLEKGLYGAALDRVQGLESWDLVSSFRAPISHKISPVIPIIHPLTKSFMQPPGGIAIQGGQDWISRSLGLRV